MSKEIKTANTGNIEDASFRLPNRKVSIKHIPRKNPMVNQDVKNHIAEGGMLTGANYAYSAPLQKNGTIKNVLTNEEKDFLENVTGLNLSVYGDFWKTFKVRLRKDKLGQTLDLSNPIDYISYKVLLSLNKTEIASSWAERNKFLSYRFAITEADEMTMTKKKDFNIKREAFKAYARIESSTEKVIGILKLLTNAPISMNTSLKVLQEKLEEFVDNEPAKFLSVVSDAQLETKMLILEGVENGYVIKTGNRYTTKDGLDLCEADEIPIFSNAVRYLDAPKNQDIRSLIEAKIYNKK